MKQVIMKRLLIAGIALLTVPASVLAQKEKDKSKGGAQTIVITRNGNLDEKTTIEIDGDKVKVNGKDTKDLNDNDVRVHVNTSRNRSGYVYNNGNYQVWNNDNFSLFNEDENRAMLGVNTQDNDKGAEIESVTDESAADKAGLKKGDVITMIGDKKIEEADDVTEAIRSKKPGDKVSITYLRDGKEQKATAELSKWKGIRMNAVTIPKISGMGGNFYTPEPFSGNVFSFGRPRLGLSIQDTEDGTGVKVLDVDDESAAAKAGIKKDDVIVGVDDSDVKSTEDVVRATRPKGDKFTYNFKVKRGGATQNIEVKIPRKLKTADL